MLIKYHETIKHINLITCMYIYIRTIASNNDRLKLKINCIKISLHTINSLNKFQRNKKVQSWTHTPFTKLTFPRISDPKWLVSKRLFRKLALMQRDKGLVKVGHALTGSWRHSRGGEDSLLISRSFACGLSCCSPNS